MLLASRGGERNAAHSVIHQFKEQFASRHARITKSEEKAVAHLTGHIAVVDDGEAVIGEYLLHPAGTAFVLAHVFHEVDFARYRTFQHLRHAVLGGGCTSRCNHIQDGSDERGAEYARIFVAFCQRRILLVEKLIGYASQGNALARITEYLRSGKHEDVIIGIARHGRHERRLVGTPVLMAEIHTEIRLVFHHHHVISGGKLADNLQFFFFQAYPCGIVRIGIDHGCNVSLCHIAF